MMRRLLLLGLLSSIGCATSSFDRHLAAGRWDEAAQSFRADSSLHNDPRALYRAALVFATPERDTFDPAAARELFNRLVTRHPRSQYAEPARHYIGLLDEIGRVRTAAVMRERRLEQEVQRLQREIDQLQLNIDSLEAKITTQSHEAETMKALVERLETSLRRCEEQMRELRVELDKLKAIDLRNAPRGGGAIDPSAGR